jgi:Hypothetical protein (DUF2513)
MKRDVDLQRSILLFVEGHSPPHGGLDKPLAISGYDRETVFAHAELLIEDGLIDGRVLRGMVGFVDVHVLKLTSAGHDAIAAAKDDTRWQKAKKTLIEKGVSVTFSVLVELLKLEARKHAGLP